MSVSEFTLGISPTPNHRGAARWIAAHALRHWPVVLLAFGGAFGNAALAGMIPILLGEAFNLITGSSPSFQRLIQIALLISLAYVARAGLQFFRGAGFELVAQRVERDIRKELYVNLLGKSMTFHNLQPVGDTMARATNDVREINFLFSPGLGLVVGSLNFLIMPVLLATRYHSTLVIVPLIFIGLYGWSLSRYLKSLAPLTDEVRVSFGKMNMRLAEALDGIETVKGASQEKGELERFLLNSRRYRNALVHQGNIEAKFIPLLLLQIALGAGLLHALLLYSQGLLTLGDAVAYFNLLLLLDFPTFISLFAYSQISLGLAGGRRILELMRQETYLDQNIQGYSLPVHGEVEFRDVCLSYENDDCSLRDISFTVKPGQMTAIVGQTGSGKTSLIRLINRTYDATDGQVLVDGVDVRNWNLETLRRNISVIEQDIFLFSRSIRDNIAFGCPDATREEVERAARSAQAHEFIQAMPEGYDTVIGERGVTLSGGQRQRIALARAFLVDPKILILDDSTSAIDSETEDRIQRAIFAAARGRTTFIITHRLSQIRWADLIIVLGKGRISTIGTHEELLQTSEVYRRIFQE
ncbi:MAG: ABC transporter ATP-binding protein [Anaerolineaceae bacterium]|nr:ABC transporter ATP-binding protein [Anaerolineaceae bacterium]